MRIPRLLLLTLAAGFLFSGCAVFWKDYTPEQRRMAAEHWNENTVTGDYLDLSQ